MYSAILLALHFVMLIISRKIIMDSVNTDQTDLVIFKVISAFVKEPPVKQLCYTNKNMH